VLEEFEEISADKILKQAEKKLASLSRAKEIPSLASMKLARWNAKVGWTNEPATDKQAKLLVDNNWLPADCNLATLTKGKAAAMITLSRVEEATRRARARSSGEGMDRPPQPATDKQKAYLSSLMDRHGHLTSVKAALMEAGLPFPLDPEAASKLNKVEASDAINVIKMSTRDSLIR